MRSKFAIGVLIGLAVLAPAADLMGLRPLKAVAAATQASPAMKVFTSHEGYETFSPRFHLDWQIDGVEHTLALTPEVYAGLRGPYNRRNAYGAVLSYSPVLSANPATRAMHASASHYALCGSTSILAELGIDPQQVAGPVTVRIEPRRALAAKWNLTYEVNCHD